MVVKISSRDTLCARRDFRRLPAAVMLSASDSSALPEHQDILDACRAGDVAGGVALLSAHIATTKKEAAAYLRRR